jgi:hypothetical protein
MRPADDLRDFVELLLSKKVEFAIVGAYALAFHKIPRYTGDIDILSRTALVTPNELLTPSTSSDLLLLVSQPKTSNRAIKLSSWGQLRIELTRSQRSPV